VRLSWGLAVSTRDRRRPRRPADGSRADERDPRLQPSRLRGNDADRALPTREPLMIWDPSEKA